MHGHDLRRDDAEAHLVAAHGEHRDAEVVTEGQGLADPAGEDEHGSQLPCWGEDRGDRVAGVGRKEAVSTSLWGILGLSALRSPGGLRWAACCSLTEGVVMGLGWLVIGAGVIVVLLLLLSRRRRPDPSSSRMKSSPGYEIPGSRDREGSKAPEEGGYGTLAEGGLERSASGARLVIREPGYSVEFPLKDGSLYLSPDVSLTLSGTQEGVTELLNELARGRRLYFPESAARLAMLTARFNLEISEIEDYRKRFRARWERAAKQHLREHPPTPEDLEIESEADLFESALEAVIDDLNERPSQWRTYQSFLVEKPVDLAADDLLLAAVDHNPALLGLLLNAWDDEPSPVEARTGDELRQWRQLVRIGLASDGPSMPAELLVGHFKVAQLKEACQPAKAPKRKQDYAALLTAEARAKLPDLNKLFVLKRPTEEFKTAVRAFEWAYEQANLLAETFRTAVHSASTFTQAKMKGLAEFSISGDCCSAARKGEEREPGRLGKRFPPFHIGCSASLDSY